MMLQVWRTAASRRVARPAGRQPPIPPHPCCRCSRAAAPHLSPTRPPTPHRPRAAQAELWGWLKSVVRDRDLARLKRDSLTLDRAPAEVTSGFLTLVLPLLQSREDVRVKVLLREHREVRTDIKLLVEDRTRTGTDRKAAVAVWRSTG